MDDEQKERTALDSHHQRKSINGMFASMDEDHALVKIFNAVVHVSKALFGSIWDGLKSFAVVLAIFWLLSYLLFR